MPASGPAYGAATYHHHEQFVLLAVCYDGSIAIACRHLIDVASLTIGNEELVAPCSAMVGRDAALDVYFAVADIVTAGTVVRDSKEVPIGSCGDGRDTIGLAIGSGGSVEDVPIALVYCIVLLCAFCLKG